jgi:hypothetical protein
MTKASELAHLFRALKAPAAAGPCPSSQNGPARSSGATSASPKRCSPPRSPPGSPTAASSASRPRASRRARGSRSSTSPSNARSEAHGRAPRPAGVPGEECLRGRTGIRAGPANGVHVCIGIRAGYRSQRQTYSKQGYGDVGRTLGGLQGSHDFSGSLRVRRSVAGARSWTPGSRECPDHRVQPFLLVAHTQPPITRPSMARSAAMRYPLRRARRHRRGCTQCPSAPASSGAYGTVRPCTWSWTA